MVSISKFAGILSCGFLLCLGLSTVASSADKLNSGQLGGQIFTVDDKKGFVAGKEIKGEIVKVEGDDRSVRRLALSCAGQLPLEFGQAAFRILKEHTGTGVRVGEHAGKSCMICGQIAVTSEERAPACEIVFECSSLAGWHVTLVGPAPHPRSCKLEALRG